LESVVDGATFLNLEEGVRGRDGFSINAFLKKTVEKRSGLEEENGRCGPVGPSSIKKIQFCAA
jgi:hypothetical protein